MVDQHTDGDGKPGAMKGNGTVNTMSSSSSASESSVETKVVSDADLRSNELSPPSSATADSFDAPDDPVVQGASCTSIPSLDNVGANEQLLALAASVAAKSTVVQDSEVETKANDVSHTAAKESTSRLAQGTCHKVTSYISLEGALLGASNASKSRSNPATDTRKVTSDSSRPRVTKPGPNKPRSTVPRQKGANSGLRRGKWTAEEEAYVARVIQDFNSGYLDAPAGTTLRTYLSEKLKCDPMRITKKFTGEACIGKRVFHPAVRTSTNAEAIEKAQVRKVFVERVFCSRPLQSELTDLEQRWRRRLETQQRESAKKAAASVAVAQAAISVPDSNTHNLGDATPLTQTASWLDRAKVALESHTENEDASNLQSRMQEMQRLICEGPSIQQTSTDLPNILNESHLDRSKRMRTTEGDAEALVGFLRTVRASVDSSSGPPPSTD